MILSFAENREGRELVKNKKNRVLRLLAAVLCLSLTLLAGCKSGKAPAGAGSEVSAEGTDADYSGYEGEWKNASSEVTLTIEKTHGNTVMFSVSKAISGQAEASLKSAVAKIEDDIASFEFSDDGYGNSGKGRLIFGKESIICSVTVDREDGGEWYVQSLAMDSEKLQKADSAAESEQPSQISDSANTESSAAVEQIPKQTETSIDLRIRHYFYLSPYDVTYDFGEVVSHEFSPETTDTMGGYTFKYQTGISVFSQSTLNVGTVDTIVVDYSVVSKTAFIFGDVDGNSTYDDVIRLMGTPESTYKSQDDLAMRYYTGDRAVDFLIDSSTSKVIGFWVFKSGY